MKEDEREEEAAAMAPIPCLRPNSKSSGITQEQFTKFQELQRRRLQIKSKSKNIKKPRGRSDAKGKLLDEDVGTKGSLDENTVQEMKDSGVSSSIKSNDKNEVSSSSPQVDVHPALKKKKLHWGLDTKERWERKANM